MKKLHRDRFLKLIAFLRKLPEEKFNFCRSISATSCVKGKWCGSVCCAAGWLPAVFPRLIHWSPRLKRAGAWTGGLVSARQRGELEYNSAVVLVFGIPNYAASSLFCPGEQEELHRSLPVCNSDAKPKEVAAMLEKFLALEEAGEIKL